MYLYLFIFRIILETRVRSYALGLVFLISLMVSNQSGCGELYYWHDKDGNVYMTDIPPEETVDRERMQTIRTFNGPSSVPEPVTPPAKLPPGYSQKKEVIYDKFTTPLSQEEKKYLLERGIDYQEISPKEKEVDIH